MQNYGTRAHSPDSQDKKNTTQPSSSSTSLSATLEEDRRRKQFDPTEMFIKDWRSYRCKTWHLEPTVRLVTCSF